MISHVKKWFSHYVMDPDILILVGLIILVNLVGKTMGHLLAPVFVSIVLAYLLQWPIFKLESWKVPHILAVIIIYLSFLGLVIIGLLGLFPLLWRQFTALFNELPTMVGHGQALLIHLPARYPEYISTDQIQNLLSEAQLFVGKLGHIILSSAPEWIPGLLSTCVYLIVVPILIYFFLIDRVIIFKWLERYLPKKRQMLSEIWDEAHTQIGNYVRGRVLEIFIVGLACYIVFAFMNLDYAMLLAALVGLSVIIPYVGAAIVSVAVIVIALLQWGWSAYFGYFMLAYASIIILDANVLVPLLFSKTVQLHPIAIILALLVFGGLWGFWGIFFAIPLASLVKAIINAVYRHVERMQIAA